MINAVSNVRMTVDDVIPFALFTRAYEVKLNRPNGRSYTRAYRAGSRVLKVVDLSSLKPLRFEPRFDTHFLDEVDLI